ncbi:MAG TPA: hypothetical protein VK669_15280 [Candidatus Limnocylindrales bacterium]|nr:hypothetical protein [Candidatus Limnocylindrales bacterium]
MTARLLTVFAALVALLGLFAAQPAEARGRDGGQTKVFDGIYVPAGETVTGDVNTVFGDAEIAGTVTGDCNAIFGTCTVDDGGHVGGKINSVNNDFVRAFVPWAMGRRHADGIVAEQDHRLLGKLLGSVIVILVFLLFPLRMRVALDRVERHPALSAVTGFFGALLAIPIGLLLLITIIGIPLIPLEIAALFAFVWIGTGAIALLVGRRLCELVMPAATPSPLVALIIGLVVVSAAEIMPLVGWIVTAIVCLVGLGSAILSFVRSTSLDSTIRRAPIGGPPATGWR